MSKSIRTIPLTLLLFISACNPTNHNMKTLPAGVTRTSVTFSAGYDTDPRDGGRPVVLIAAALGVTPDLFREAFSRVRPAPGGAEPSTSQVTSNKTVLLAALDKYGVTNARLDSVSDYYRYAPGRNSLWALEPAIANALVKDGAIVGYELVSGGSGYSSVPLATVRGFPGARPTITLIFGRVMSANGAIESIT